MTSRLDLAAAEDRDWAELTNVASSLTPEQMTEPGYTAEGWSVKDLVAHIGAWQAEAAQVFEQIRWGTYVKKRWDVEGLNRQFYEANRDLPLSVIRAECAASRNRMLLEWNALPEITPEADEWFRESGSMHYAEHLPRLRQWVEEMRGT